MCSFQEVNKHPILKVHWNCYGHCNMSCDFCYAWFENKPSLNTSESIKLLNSIYSILGPGIKFVFGGGDPLMRKDIVQLVKYAHNELDFRVELQTNAVKLQKDILYELANDVSYWGFSLDGEDEETHTKMRTVKSNFKHIFDLLNELDIIKKQGGNIEVTIRTLISQKNKFWIKNLYDLLIPHTSISKWSLRQFVPLEDGLRSKVVHEIELSEFNEVVSQILFHVNDFHKVNSSIPERVKIAKITQTDMERCYCLIAPNGDVYYHPEIEENYKSVGNIIKSNPSIVFNEISERCVNREERDKRKSLIFNYQ